MEIEGEEVVGGESDEELNGLESEGAELNAGFNQADDLREWRWTPSAGLQLVQHFPADREQALIQADLELQNQRRWQRVLAGASV